jgi:methylglutamate dehydrogenase subunit D
VDEPPRLVERSALWRVVSVAGQADVLPNARVRLSERRGVSLATVMVRNGKYGELSDALNRAFGLELPAPGRRLSNGSLALTWSSPGQWLARAERTDRSAFEIRLRSALSSVASISNQSDGRTILRIAGAGARDVLAKGVPIDLHPTVFGPGQTASTVVAHINCHFWQLDNTPTFEFAVFRSFALEFWKFLTEAAAESGYIIEHG